MSARKPGGIEVGLRDDQANPSFWITVAVVIMALGSLAYTNHFFTVVDVEEGLINVGPDIFFKYLVIVIAVERAAAVYVGISMSNYRVDWSLRINRLHEVLAMENPPLTVLKQVYSREHRLIRKLEAEKLVGIIEPVGDNAVADDYIGYLTSTKHAYEFHKARYSAIINRKVARLVFMGGIVLAALGLSVFSDLLQNVDLASVLEAQVSSGQLSPSGISLQTLLLRLSDIVITGGLLGGGSAGLNAVANKAADMMNR